MRLKPILIKKWCIEELDELKDMNSGKAPGPDGLLVEIYTKLSGKLLSYLL